MASQSPAAGQSADGRALCLRVLAFSYTFQVFARSSLGNPNSDSIFEALGPQFNLSV